MLGLRSLYFLLADVVARFRYLRPGIAVILLFVAAKMLLEAWIPISADVSLAVILSILVTALLASLVVPAHRSGSSSTNPSTRDLRGDAGRRRVPP